MINDDYKTWCSAFISCFACFNMIFIFSIIVDFRSVSAVQQSDTAAFTPQFFVFFFPVKFLPKQLDTFPVLYSRTPFLMVVCFTHFHIIGSRGSKGRRDEAVWFWALSRRTSVIPSPWMEFFEAIRILSNTRLLIPWSQEYSQLCSKMYPQETNESWKSTDTSQVC